VLVVEPPAYPVLVGATSSHTAPASDATATLLPLQLVLLLVVLLLWLFLDAPRIPLVVVHIRGFSMGV
jgi:hypothetical protein